MQDLKKEAGAVGQAVEKTISRLREEVLDRIIQDKVKPRLRAVHEPDIGELERELAAVELRLATWRLRREGKSEKKNADTRFTSGNEKRAAALRAAIERLKSGNTGES